MKGWIILAQISSELPISPKRYFLAKLTVTIVFFHAATFQEILKEKIMRQKVA